MAGKAVAQAMPQMTHQRMREASSGSYMRHTAANTTGCAVPVHLKSPPYSTFFCKT